MKYLCGACERLVELKAYRVEAGALVAACPACGQETRTGPPPAPLAPPPEAPRPTLAPTTAGSNVVELRSGPRDGAERARALAAERPFAVPQDRCPKCITARRPEATTCASCGAVFELVSPEALMPEPWLRDGWVQLLGAWGDPARHDALLVLATEKSELPALGRLYRLFLAQVPDDPAARRGRDEVLRRASVPSLAVAEAPRSGSGKTLRTALMAVVTVGALVALGLLVRALLGSQG